MIRTPWRIGIVTWHACAPDEVTPALFGPKRPTMGKSVMASDLPETGVDAETLPAN